MVLCIDRYLTDQRHDVWGGLCPFMNYSGHFSLFHLLIELEIVSLEAATRTTTRTAAAACALPKRLRWLNLSRWIFHLRRIQDLVRQPHSPLGTSTLNFLLHFPDSLTDSLPSQAEKGAFRELQTTLLTTKTCNAALHGVGRLLPRHTIAMAHGSLDFDSRSAPRAKQWRVGRSRAYALTPPSNA